MNEQPVAESTENAEVGTSEGALSVLRRGLRQSVELRQGLAATAFMGLAVAVGAQVLHAQRLSFGAGEMGQNTALSFILLALGQRLAVTQHDIGDAVTVVMQTNRLDIGA